MRREHMMYTKKLTGNQVNLLRVAKQEIDEK